MKRIMNFLMLSCKKASALIDKKYLFKLGRKEKMMLKLHTAMCDACTAYEKQSMLIDKILQTHLQAGSDAESHIIENKELQDKIISKL